MELKARTLLIIFVITLILGISGYIGIRKSQILVNRLVKEEFLLLQAADELQIFNLQLRRYEKDIFLNIEDHGIQLEYQNRFMKVLKNMRKELDKIIPVLEKIPDIENSTKQAVFSIREHIDTYEKGANKLFKSAIYANTETPQELNTQMEEYKIETHQIEADLNIFTKAIDDLISKRLIITIKKTCLYNRIITFLMLFFLITVSYLLFKYYISSSSNIRLHRKNKELNIISCTDKLTGLYNRHYLDNKLQNWLEDSSKDKNRLWCIFMADIDHFKNINDTWGHPVGDKVLIQFSNRLKLSLREDDVLIRWGGEEFLFLILDADNRKVKDLARRVVKVISDQDFNGYEPPVNITCSVGYCIFPMERIGTPSDINRFIEFADMALYHAKQNGRNKAAGLHLNNSGFDVDQISDSGDEIKKRLIII